MPPSLQALVKEKLSRTIKDSLEDFAVHALSPLGFMPAAHHKLLISKLEAVERGDIKRLMVAMPPGSAKSTYVSVLFPAWFIARNSNKSIIAASHTADLADSFSRKVQSMVREHGDLLNYNMVNEAASLWQTSNGGQYKAAGVGGPVTGFRADCVTGDTIVHTLAGSIPIKDVVVGTESGYVLSYAKETASSVFRRVVAIARRDAKTIWRIHTGAGNVVEATGNHRFYTSRGWAEASSLVVGDVLLRSLSGARREVGRRSQEASKQAVVLRKGMLNPHYERSERLVGQGMQPLFCANGRTSKGAEGLLRQLPSGHSSEAFVCQSNSSIPSPLPILQRSIHSAKSRRQGFVLQSGMLKPNACVSHDGREQSGLEEWSQSNQITEAFCKSVPLNKTIDSKAGRVPVCGLREARNASSSSHQYGCFGQSLGESSDTLRDLSHEMAWRGAFQTQEDVVALVECVHEPATVYDIQVDGTECFFANGILIHNCAIIDDPVKSRADADSSTYRERAYNWFKADLSTRLKPGAPCVLVMTRWHEDDLAGRLLQDSPDGWEVVSLPALAIENDPLGRIPGQPLWSDDSYGYGAELERIQRETGERDWFSLYQQSPRPITGSIFKTQMITAIEAAPAGLHPVRAWDLASTAATGTRDPDWTVGVLMAKTPAGTYVILDVVRLRGGPEETENAIISTATRDGRRVPVLLPQDPGQAGKSQVAYLTRKLAGYTVKSGTETGDKATRAMPFASQVNVGNVSMVSGPWNKAFLDELAMFPSGSKDDQVDALSRAFADVNDSSAIARFMALAS